MIRTITVGEMIDLQRELNDLTFPDWENKLTANDYQTAIIDELSELLCSGRNFKWWKASGNPDTFNEKIEVIDILHFALSVLVVNGTVNNPRTNLDQFIGYEDASNVRTPMFMDDGSFDRGTFMYVTRSLMGQTDVNDINYLVRSIGLSAEETSAIYVAKAALNKIRQDRGYKTGGYMKVVDGVEDNQRLAPIVDAFMHDTNLTLDDVYKAVEEEFYVKTEGGE